MKKIFPILIIIAILIILGISEVQAVTSTTTQLNTATDTTITTATELPKAGLKNMVIISIAVIGIMGTGSYIRAKTIKIK